MQANLKAAVKSKPVSVVEEWEDLSVEVKSKLRYTGDTQLPAE